MGQILKGFPSLPSFTQTVILGDQEYVIRFTWRARTSSWYFDLWTVDSVPVIAGRRMSPDWSPLIGLALDNQPTGFLFVRGPGLYVRDDLGTDLLLIRYADDELPPVVPDPDAPVVVVT